MPVYATCSIRSRVRNQISVPTLPLKDVGRQVATEIETNRVQEKLNAFDDDGTVLCRSQIITSPETRVIIQLSAMGVSPFLSLFPLPPATRNI